jgi:hypothetical protein
MFEGASGSHERVWERPAVQCVCVCVFAMRRNANDIKFILILLNAMQCGCVDINLGRAAVALRVVIHFCPARISPCESIQIGYHFGFGG